VAQDKGGIREATLRVLRAVPPLALITAWLLPGFVHLLLGKRFHAALFLICVVVFFVVGDIASDFYGVSSHYHFYAFVAQLCAGVPVLVHLAVCGQPSSDTFVGRISPYYDAGVIYMMVAGLLNVAAVADALERLYRRTQDGDGD